MTRQLVLGVWALVVAGVLACEPLSVLTRRRTASVTTVLGLLTASPLSAGAVVVGWMWLGWHLFAR